MSRSYNQAKVTVLVDGIPLKGFMDGTPVVVTPKGGEVETTEGMDGPAINIATSQGGVIKLKLKENSSSRAYLNALRLAQKNGGPGVQVALRSGVDVIETLSDAFISVPGELATGDKKQGGIEYTFVGLVLASSNLGLS